MIYKEANLKINKVFINAAYFYTYFKKAGDKDLAEIPLEIDFNVLEEAVGSRKGFSLIMEIATSSEDQYKEAPGYRFSVLAEGRFTFSGRMDATQKKHYMYDSALSMMISTVRGYLMNVSSYAPYGQYILPAVSLNHLILDKLKEDKVKAEAKDKE